MAAFEKGKRDNQSPLFLAKIAKRIVEYFNELTNAETGLLGSFLSQCQTKWDDIGTPNYLEYVRFIQPVWIAIMNSIYGKYLYVELQKQREGMACIK